ncbi:ATP-binding cassette domain-containing protein [Corynebacterium tapiri]|uniref:UvrABC system protein A n=1 Tax=Corynebacterium tapiri TaxID=1448266 RepID=A0A5C4U6L9_9CORY|nr:excinuclease ABC subunit UvrA [Corynebacterium tapiri]TNM00542.1 excinuclease ABC subunit UvrA [Corynebacterium tapiri]
MNPTDPHEAIRLRGARVNNLQAVDVDIPKRQLTVLTGVSGSGKSSLAFDTIAAESQRLINETYSTFVQGFMPSLARPDYDELSGLTAAIVVDQSPMGSNPRSTVGTATDAVGPMRVLFSRIAEPSVGGPGAYSFNVPSVSGGGAIQVGNKKKVVKQYRRTGGMCPNCEGRGQVSDVVLSELVDEDLSLADGALRIPGYKTGGWNYRLYAESGLVDPEKKIRDYTKEEHHNLFFHEEKRMKIAGINMSYEGLVPRLQKSMLAKERASMQKHIGEFVDRAVRFITCPECDGTRLAEHARTSTIEGKSIADLCTMEVGDLVEWFSQLRHSGAQELIDSIRAVLQSFVAVGLDYLTLDRPTSSLSGGEAQRAKMIRHLGSALTDATYVFDEPSAGLHPEDIGRVNDLLEQLRDKSNTVIVVEHNPATIMRADHVIDVGPGAGSAGGHVVFEGTPQDLAVSDTVTGRHLADRTPLKSEVRTPQGHLEVHDATRNNLQSVNVQVPLGVLTAITGVAGSGKSSLVAELAESNPDLVVVDQSPIAGSRRSNPATYTGALDSIRKAFAKATGTKPALFSANSEGACPQCKGAGVVYVDLGFMQGADTLCEVCEGRRFDAAVLEYTFGDYSIADVLDMPASQAAEFFAAKETKVPAAAKICNRLVQVGLGYITLGQPLSTLSGGERQRLKLAARMGEKAQTIILDEPTTGLHLADTEVILSLLDALVDAGTSVIVIEHNLAVIAHADHVIDMGPGAGSQGGQVVFAGTPAELAAADTTTGRHLAAYKD